MTGTSYSHFLSGSRNIEKSGTLTEESLPIVAWEASLLLSLDGTGKIGIRNRGKGASPLNIPKEHVNF